MEKPISMQIDEFKKNIYDTINSFNVPLCIKEMVLKDIYIELKTLSDNQKHIECEEYNKTIQEQIENNSEYKNTESE